MFCRSDDDTTFFFVDVFHYILDLCIAKGTRGSPGRKYLGRRAARASQTSTMPMEGQLFYHSPSSKQISLKPRPQRGYSVNHATALLPPNR